MLYNSYNSSINRESITNSLIYSINSNYLNKNLNNTLEKYSSFNTESKTGKRRLNYQRDYDTIDDNSVTEFKYDDTEEDENNKKEYITSLANEFMNKSNNLKEIEENVNNNLNEIRKWLSTIELQNYYNNFIDNRIYDINILINKMKSYYTKLNFQDIESILKIDKKGYSYRILLKLQIDAGLIDTKIIKFMLKNKNMCDNRSPSKNNLKLSISHDYNCFGCCKENFLQTSIKNDLKCFLTRYGLMDLYQNFYHNGFDLINFVILQMYSDNPITDEILENHFHIYDYEKRCLVLKALMEEIKKINHFLESNEYNDNPNKDLIKYENIIFEENSQSNNKYISNQKIMSECFIF